MADINKIAGLCIRDKKLLIVYKKTDKMYITLGGKIEAGETDLECLKREVREELRCGIQNPVYFETFEGRTYDNSKSIHMKCYFLELTGEPAINPADSIDHYRWIDKNYKKEGILVAPLLEQKVIPELIKKGLL